MAFTKEIPQWENAGQKPPQSKISEGFKPMDHPPADWFNWYMNGTYEALNELQSEAATTTEVTAGLKVLSNDIAEHSNAKNNPHAVTKSQIGLGNVENIKQASKADFNSHVGDSKIHVTEAEKDKWNNGQLYKLTQNNGKPIYKGVSETTDYNEITDTGLYLIYNKGVNGPPSTNASFMIVISYTSTLLQTTYSTDGKKSYYRIRKADSAWTEWTRVLTEGDKIPQSEIDKWNNGQLYKLTPNDGKVARVPNGTDIFKLPTGPYMGAQLLNAPVENDTSFYYVDVFETAYEQNEVVYKRIVATRSFDNITWIGTFHAQGFKGWERIITSGDAKLDWKFPTIRNGWKTYKSEVNNDYRVRVAKDALGIVHVTGAIAGGTLGEVPAFTLPEGCEPPFPLYNVGIASSTGGFKGPQFSRQYIATDGRFCIQDTTSNKDFIVVNCLFKAKE
ncbi:pyocin knob domain-containing protein [Bacillus safensis]|uniref:pyocin knob domain-containing protein n=1 Tax=Bacillus safensis TaxID=561879 RepID=UPI000A424177|nr:pyocin knob domain-containing protein [Bacillus safensis]